MSIDVEKPQTQAQADLNEVCRLLSEGTRPTDPALLGRIERRAHEAREEALRLRGV